VWNKIRICHRRLPEGQLRIRRASRQLGAAMEHFWTNLLLLGFDCAAMESQHGVVFEQEMFRRSGSVKGVNVVVQFLLHKLDPAHTKETFKAVWPIIDRAQEKDFRRLMFARLSELERDGHLPPNSVRLSDLTSAKVVICTWLPVCLTVVCPGRPTVRDAVAPLKRGAATQPHSSQL
jgi:hypothetical protein